MQTYLVEHYRPGLDAEALRQAARVVRAAAGALAGEGERVRYLHTTVVPADEAFLAVIEAASEDVVREAYLRAGTAFDRITLAVPEGPDEDGSAKATPK